MTKHATIYAALAAAQSEMADPVMDRVNTHFKSRYATLSSFLAEVRPVLGKHGVSMSQGFTADGKAFRTMLRHESGESIEEGVIPVASIPAKAQELGSLVTYLRRYSLGSALGLAPDEDDDGNDASGPDRRAQRAQEQQREKAATALNEMRAEVKELLAEAGVVHGDGSADAIAIAAEAAASFRGAWDSVDALQTIADFIGRHPTPAAARAAAGVIVG